MGDGPKYFVDVSDAQMHTADARGYLHKLVAESLKPSPLRTHIETTIAELVSIEPRFGFASTEVQCQTLHTLLNEALQIQRTHRSPESWRGAWERDATQRASRLELLLQLHHFIYDPQQNDNRNLCANLQARCASIAGLLRLAPGHFGSIDAEGMRMMNDKIRDIARIARNQRQDWSGCHHMQLCWEMLKDIAQNTLNAEQFKTDWTTYGRNNKWRNTIRHIEEVERPRRHEMLNFFEADSPSEGASRSVN